jgi:hypothetical protein
VVFFLLESVEVGVLRIVLVAAFVVEVVEQRVVLLSSAEVLLVEQLDF